MTIRRLFLAGAIACTTASCEDGGPLNLNGSIAFSHSGAVSGSFDATGRVPFLDVNSNAWAAGSRDDQNGLVAAVGLVPRASDRFDMVALSIPRLTPGSSTITANCTGQQCAVASVDFSLSDSDADFSHICLLTSGTIAISSISDNRVSGSFSGSGVCTNASNQTQSFTVSGGTFDVPILGILPVGP